MIYLVTALPSEARPFIEKYALKRDLACKGREIFRSDRISLIVGGMGKLRASIATTYLLTGDREVEKSCAINIGICGAKSRPAGELTLINRVVDAQTSRSYLSDIIFRHSLREESITTVDVPVLDGAPEHLVTELVDMESAGFFEAAHSFLPPSQIFLLKIVSDNLRDVSLTRDVVTELISSHLETIDTFIGKTESMILSRTGILDESQQQILEDLGCTLRLTASQRSILADHAKRLRSHGGNFPELTHIVSDTASTTDRDRIFREILRAFTPPALLASLR